RTKKAPPARGHCKRSSISRGSPPEEKNPPLGGWKTGGRPYRVIKYKICPAIDVLRFSPIHIAGGRGYGERPLKGGRKFLLTRVTRIFQKNVFTKTARAGPAGAAAGFFVARTRAPAMRLSVGGLEGDDMGFQIRGVARSARSSPAIGDCKNGWPVLLPCFRPVIYREPYNSAVSRWIECASGGAIAAYGASRTGRQAAGRSAILSPGLGFDGGAGRGGATASVNQFSSSLSQPSSAGRAGCGLQSVLSDGQTSRTWK